jgi:hydrogenase maturation protease
MHKPIPLLLLGLGNVLCGDDGLGVAAVHELARRYVVPADVRLIDGGTLGLSLLPYIEDAQRAVLIDAVRADAPAGTLLRLQGADVAAAVAYRLSTHQVGVADMLDAARWRDRLPEPLVLFGIVPASLDLGVSLSPTVWQRLPDLVVRVAAAVAELGYELSAKVHDEGVGTWIPGHVTGSAWL